jgi:hypothetical protein
MQLMPVDMWTTFKETLFFRLLCGKVELGR